MSTENLKKDIVTEIKNYWNKCDTLKQNKECFLDETKYSKTYIENVQKEISKEINNYRNEFYQSVRAVRDKYINQLKPKSENIGTLEYQIRLSNLLKLVELSDGILIEEQLKFMIESNDTQTLRLLSNKYKRSFTLKEAVNKSNLDYLKEEYKMLCQEAENGIAFDTFGVNRNSVLATFR